MERRQFFWKVADLRGKDNVPDAPDRYVYAMFKHLGVQLAMMYTEEEIVGTLLGHNPCFPSVHEWLEQDREEASARKPYRDWRPKRVIFGGPPGVQRGR